MKKHEEHEIYYKKAILTCIDNGSTSATWYFNFVMAYEKLLEKYKKLKKIHENSWRYK